MGSDVLVVDSMVCRLEVWGRQAGVEMARFWRMCWPGMGLVIAGEEGAVGWRAGGGEAGGTPSGRVGGCARRSGSRTTWSMLGGQQRCVGLGSRPDAQREEQEPGWTCTVLNKSSVN